MGAEGSLRGPNGLGLLGCAGSNGVDWPQPMGGEYGQGCLLLIKERLFFHVYKRDMVRIGGVQKVVKRNELVSGVAVGDNAMHDERLGVVMVVMVVRVGEHTTHTLRSVWVVYAQKTERCSAEGKVYKFELCGSITVVWLYKTQQEE